MPKEQIILVALLVSMGLYYLVAVILRKIVLGKAHETMEAFEDRISGMPNKSRPSFVTALKELSTELQRIRIGSFPDTLFLSHVNADIRSAAQVIDLTSQSVSTGLPSEQPVAFTSESITSSKIGVFSMFLAAIGIVSLGWVLSIDQRFLFICVSAYLVLWSITMMVDKSSDLRAGSLFTLSGKVRIRLFSPLTNNALQNQLTESIYSLKTTCEDFSSAVTEFKKEASETPELISTKVTTQVKGALDKMANVNNELQSSITKHNEVIQSIPVLLGNNVSQEVQEGLKSVKGTLERMSTSIANSYDSFSTSLQATTTKLVHMVNDLENAEPFDKWFESLNHTTTSITSVGKSVQKFFDDSIETGKSVRSISSSIENMHAMLTDGIKDLNGLNSLRGQNDAILREYLKNLFHDNLQKIEARHIEFTKLVSDFSAVVAKDHDTKVALKESLPRVVNQLNTTTVELSSLLNHLKSVPADYAKILKDLNASQKTSTDENFRILKDGIEDFNKSQREKQKELVDTLTSSIQEMHQLTKANVHQLHDQSTAFLRDSNELFSHYNEQTNELKSSLTDFSSDMESSLKSYFEDIRKLQANSIEEIGNASVKLQKQFAGNARELESAFKAMQKLVKSNLQNYESLSRAHAEASQNAIREAGESLENTLVKVSGMFDKFLKDFNAFYSGSEKRLEDMAQSVQSSSQETEKLMKSIRDMLQKRGNVSVVHVINTIISAGILGGVLYYLYRTYV